MELITAVVLIGGLILSTLPTTTSRVTLLPEADGHVGSVVITADNGSRQTLDQAYATANIQDRGPIEAQVGDSQELRQRYAATLAAQPAPPVSFTLYFEFGSGTDLQPSFQPVWEKIVATLPQYPAPEFTVIGHTDTVGSSASNDALSLQRAMTVRDLLVRLGVPAATIAISGRGERELLVITADEVVEPKNRRVEINLR